MTKVMGSLALERRRAVVIMSDGVDNALDGSNFGSQMSFADLLEAVRKSDELLFMLTNVGN